MFAVKLLQVKLLGKEGHLFRSHQRTPLGLHYLLPQQEAQVQLTAGLESPRGQELTLQDGGCDKRVTRKMEVNWPALAPLHGGVLCWQKCRGEKVLCFSLAERQENLGGRKPGCRGRKLWFLV